MSLYLIRSRRRALCIVTYNPLSWVDTYVQSSARTNILRLIRILLIDHVDRSLDVSILLLDNLALLIHSKVVRLPDGTFLPINVADRLLLVGCLVVCSSLTLKPKSLLIELLLVLL